MVPVELLQGRDCKLRGDTRPAGEQQAHVAELLTAPPFSQLQLWIPDQLCSFILDTSCAANPQITLFFTVKTSKILIINMDELWELGLMLHFAFLSKFSTG